MESIVSSQSRLESFLERMVDMATGVFMAYFTYRYLVPLVYPEYTPPPGPALGIVFIFTIQSVVRGYFWRRFFNNRVHLAIHQALSNRYGLGKTKT